MDEVTGMSQLVVTDSPDEKRQPQVIVRPEGATGSRSEAKKYLMPTHAHLMVRDGEEVHAGDVLAKIPRETTKTKDITGGLPRVVELFEARKPRETAIIAEINGMVKYGEVTKGQRKIYVEGDDGEKREYSLPRGVHINVQEGERVKAGEPLMDGPRNPHDILDVLGEKELQKYLVNEIQEVYRLQGVNINDKHLEVISRQMMRWVKVEDIGDTEFLPEEVVDKFKFRAENLKTSEAGGRPAQGKAMLLGITKASLSTDSFISAASFQETTRVLTEAAINGKVDYLRGLKENVIMGRLVPAGTGMEYYRQVKIAGEDVVEEPGRAGARCHPRVRRRDAPAVRRRAARRHRRRIAGRVRKHQSDRLTFRVPVRFPFKAGINEVIFAAREPPEGGCAVEAPGESIFRAAGLKSSAYISSPKDSSRYEGPATVQPGDRVDSDARLADTTTVSSQSAARMIAPCVLPIVRGRYLLPVLSGSSLAFTI